MRYLVKMTPLEAYAFGTEQGFEYPGEKGTGKETYFMRSAELPEQTTILGMLRFIVLEHKGLLRTDFVYTPDQQVEIKKCIGEKSFQFSEREVQTFGCIKKISPLFLVKNKSEKTTKDVILIRNPFHNKSKKGYEPIRMSAKKFCTSAGMISLPLSTEYDAKKGYATGFFNLATEEVEDNIFSRHVVQGKRKDGTKASSEDSYFKRELVTMMEGYSFAVYLEADDIPDRVIAHMGQKKSAFLVTAELTDDKELCEQVEDTFAKYQYEAPWQYALSDIMNKDIENYQTFCIIEEKFQRNLETIYSEENQLRKLKKSRIRYNLIKSGSVFYETSPFPSDMVNGTQIGYNQIVQLGGR